jgi:hypothetical protein
MSALGSQEDAYRPSLFELVAQEKLKELLQPAVQYVLAVCMHLLFFFCLQYANFFFFILRYMLNVILVYCCELSTTTKNSMLLLCYL